MNILQGSNSLVVSGPLWTGPLHDATHLTEMLDLAKRWGWVTDITGTGLEKLLNRMLDECDPRLPSGYIKLDEVCYLHMFLSSFSFCFIILALHYSFGKWFVALS